MCFLDDFAACIAHLKLPLAHRKATRTTNLLERLFGEERRRTKIIPHAFGERAVLKLMYAALLRAIDRAVYELNRSRYWAYDAQTSVLKLMSTTSRDRKSTRLNSSHRT